MFSQSFKNVLVVLVLLLLTSGWTLIAIVPGRIFIILLFVLAYSAGMVSEKTKNQRLFTLITAISSFSLAAMCVYGFVWLLTTNKAALGWLAIGAPFYILGEIVLSVVFVKAGLKYWRLAKSL